MGREMWDVQTCEGNKAVSIDDAVNDALAGRFSAQGELPRELLTVHAVQVHLHAHPNQHFY